MYMEPNGITMEASAQRKKSLWGDHWFGGNKFHFYSLIQLFHHLGKMCGWTIGAVLLYMNDIPCPGVYWRYS